MTVHQFAKARRDASVVREWLAGLPVGEIAAHHGIKLSTVVATARRTPGAIAERQARLGQAEECRRRAAVAWSLAHPGESLSAGADVLGVSRAQLRSWLGSRVSLHPVRAFAGPVISDEEIIAAVRAWLETSGGDTREASYRSAAKRNGWPSGATAIGRFTTWQNLLSAAGVVGPNRRGRGPSWTDEELVAVVREYFASQPAPWTWRGLDRWLRQDPARPSPQTLRGRLGRWPAILTLAAFPPPVDD